MIFYKREDAIKYLVKVKFRIIYIIISGSLFSEFISQLKDVIYEISVILKIIIFTSKSTKLFCQFLYLLYYKLIEII